MKIRNGFVSNSSSSSFVVGFPKIPTSEKHLKEMMFGNIDTIELYDETAAVDDIVTRVYNDIKNENRVTKRQAVKVLLEGNFPGAPRYNYNETRESDKIEEAYFEETGKRIYDAGVDSNVRKLYAKAQMREWEETRKMRKLAAKSFIEGFWPSVKGMKVFRFEYSDNNGEAILEHGNIFRRLPHVRVSKH